jgi:RNA polymerase sigma factor (sigma-70 family)
MRLMQGEFAKQPDTSDEELVRECLAGNSDAWSELIRKYRNLIVSIPIKYGFSRDEATDIFQEVCLTLLKELRRLRDPQALPGWLIEVTSHRCFYSRTKDRRAISAAVIGLEDPPGPVVVREDLLDSLRREQILREVLNELPSRCRRLIEMLFFTYPAVPYERIAETLGLATGSIGFIRMRCLRRLRKELENRGFR